LWRIGDQLRIRICRSLRMIEENKSLLINITIIFIFLLI
jgi:hypothetical protein